MKDSTNHGPAVSKESTGPVAPNYAEGVSGEAKGSNYGCGGVTAESGGGALASGGNGVSGGGARATPIYFPTDYGSPK